MGTGVQFIKKQAIRFLARDRNRRAEPAATINDLGNPDDVFRSELASKQRNARQANCLGEPLYQCGLADTRWALDENWTHNGYVQQEFAELFLRESNRSIHIEIRTHPPCSAITNRIGRNFPITSMFVRACMFTLSAVKDPAPAKAMGRSN